MERRPDDSQIQRGFKMKTKRQALSITLNELISLFIDLRIQQKEFMEQFQLKNKPDFDEKFQINIINKTPECSDTWEIEMGAIS